MTDRIKGSIATMIKGVSKFFADQNDPINHKARQARVEPETLNDGSTVVFNVMVGEEEIAHLTTEAEAQELCDEYNRRHNNPNHEMDDAKHEQVLLSCVRRNGKGIPIMVLAAIQGQVLIGGKLYTIGQHCWLDLKRPHRS